MNRDNLLRAESAISHFVGIGIGDRARLADAETVAPVIERELHTLNGYSTHETYHLALVVDSDELLSVYQRGLAQAAIQDAEGDDANAEPNTARGLDRATQYLANSLREWCDEMVNDNPRELHPLAEALLRLALDGVDWHAYASRAIEREIEG